MPKLPQISPARQLAAFTAAATVAIAPIADHEGLRNAAYQDVAKVWTICYGETQGVARGQWRSTEFCQSKLALRVQEHAAGMARCTHVEIPRQSLVALIDFGYNVGVGAYCKSTLTAKLNAGDLAGACAQLPRWNKAGGVVWPGLVERRAWERAQCERGLA